MRTRLVGRRSNGLRSARPARAGRAIGCAAYVAWVVALSGCTADNGEDGGTDAVVADARVVDGGADGGDGHDGAADAAVPDAGCSEGEVRPCADSSCVNGTQTCVEGEWAACEGTAERCNALDDDCDGDTDEDFLELDTPCTAGVGACAATGTFRCAPDGEGVECGAAPGQPRTPRCNGVDDDCDGVVDEGWPELGHSCAAGVGACAASGVMICSEDGNSVTCDAQATPATEERCGNEIDDDCDGTTDEGFVLGEPCQVGVGACRATGNTICSPDGLSAVCDAVAGAPGEELCGTELDEDCDGDADEGFDLDVPCTVGVGACVRNGTTICADDDRAAICNVEPGAPVDERCGNSIDDDCDGQIDEAFPVGDACMAGVGACARPGVFVCSPDGFDVICDGVPAAASRELCGSRVDEDCDGQIDEGFETGVACTVGIGACTRTGAQVCTRDGLDVTCGAVPGQPEAERCGTTIDEDCDGLVDEGFLVGLPCVEGVGVCARLGATVCDAERDGVICDAVAGAPQASTCDGEDDDCDGAIDESFAELGAPCSTGVGGCTRDGVLTCNDARDGVACDAEAGDPTDESCNDVDDDCDGAIDEEFAELGDPCSAGTGACFADGVLVCNSAGDDVQCGAQPGEPVAETCNGSDDDCNGLPDNDCACQLETDCPDGQICVVEICQPPDLECAVDPNEGDDAAVVANALVIGRQFSLNFCDDGTDWITFEATAGESYDLQTSRLGPSADTSMQLYDRDSTTLLLSNDDGGGDGLASLIPGWVAPESGTYYATISSVGGSNGPDRSYSVGVRLSCEDDDFEHDDRFEDARQYTVDSGPQARAHCQDEDWVHFQAATDARYLIETVALVGSADTVLELYDLDGTRISTNDDFEGEPRSAIQFRSPADAIYLVRIRSFGDAYGGERGYSLSITEEPCLDDSDCRAGESCINGECLRPECDPDEHEEDDSFADAATMQVGELAHLNFCDDAIDYIAFTASAGTTYDFQTSNLDLGNDTTMELLDTDGETVLEFNDDEDADANIRSSLIEGWLAPNNGRYFLRIRSYSDRVGPNRGYWVGLRHSCTDDQFEHDDTSELANLYEVGGPVRSMRHCQDEDWVSFQGDAGVPYRIETNDLVGSSNTYLEVYDSDGVTLLAYNGSVAFALGQRRSQVVYVPERNDTFLVRIRSFNDLYGGNRAYSFSIAIADCQPDGFEEDDELRDATPLNVNGQLRANFCDDASDFVRFTGQQGARYDIQTFNLERPNVSPNTSVLVFDSEGQTLAQSPAESDDGLASYIEGFEAPLAGTYYVLTMSPVYGAGTEYSLSVRDACLDDEFEHDDDSSRAVLVAVDSPPQARAHCQDEDWIAFDGVEGTTYVIETSDLSASNDTVISLWDTDAQTLLLADDNGGDGVASRIEFTPDASGRYFARIGNVSNEYGGDRTYVLTVRSEN